VGPKRRVVVTGVGAITPVGHDAAATWEAVVAGRSGVAPITSFDTSELPTRIAAEVKDFEPRAHFEVRGTRRLDRCVQFAVIAEREAVADARLDMDEKARSRTAVIVGSGAGGVSTVVQQVRVMDQWGPGRISPLLIPRMLADSAPAQISIEFGITGPNMAMLSACATGNNAIGEAWAMICHGVVDAALCGGTEAAILPLIVGGFNVMGVLSTRHDVPPRACRPFDARRDGFVMGEGAVVLVLELLDKALERGAHIHAELVGYGASADAYHMASPREDGAGAILAMQWALDSASLQPTAVDYINAHGTGTLLNDLRETQAIKALFGSHAYHLAVSSTKAVTGHMLGGAGALEALICCKVLETGVVPPTINYTAPDPECDLDYVPNQARQASVRTAMNNSFGLGGHNAALILRRWDAKG
jgi:3-oxoacyl-[acyl-carrier-protein] synthase II